MIKINVSLFLAAVICVSKDEIRYNLNGVYVQPHPEAGALVVATDGRRMLVLHDETGECTKPGIIAADKLVIAAAKAVATADDEHEDRTIRVDDDGLVSVPAANFRGIDPGLINGVYPDWTAVIRPVLGPIKAKTHGLASFNTQYLADFAKIATILKRAGATAAARIVSFNEQDPALVLFPDFDSGFGIIMPMTSPAVDALPMFMRPVLEAEPQSKAA